MSASTSSARTENEIVAVLVHRGAAAARVGRDHPEVLGERGHVAERRRRDVPAQTGPVDTSAAVQQEERLAVPVST